MRKFVVALLLVVSPFLSWSQQISYTYTDFTPDPPASFRGVSVIDSKVAWASGTKGTVVLTKNGGSTWEIIKVKGFESTDFRSIYAFSAQKAVIAGISSPAYILLTTNAGSTWSIVYKNEHPDAFIDGMDFWNEKEGMAYGDPINGKMFLIRTTDGGQTWKELPETCRPELIKGEASFAASGTGIRSLQGNKLAILSGGMQSRLFLSANKGNKWDSLRLPIIQGKETTGAFSVAFADKNNGIVTGGDFQADTLRSRHVFYTGDGGKSWTSPLKPTGGYRECVEFINGKTAIAIGPAGADISYDQGKSWIALNADKGFHVVRKARKGSLIVMAGNGKLRVATPKY